MLLINEHKVSQVICLFCFRRWIAARPTEVRLTDLECPGCRKQGFAIETGETSVVEDMLKEAREELERETVSEEI